MYVNVNLYLKISAYKKYISNSFFSKQDILNYYNSLLAVVSKAEQQINRIDRKGYFKNDDETGFIFTMLQKEIDNLKERLELLNLNANETE